MKMKCTNIFAKEKIVLPTSLSELVHEKKWIQTFLDCLPIDLSPCDNNFNMLLRNKAKAVPTFIDYAVKLQF